MPDDTWPTAITKVEPNKLLLRGYRIDELMGRVSFPQGDIFGSHRRFAR